MGDSLDEDDAIRREKARGRLLRATAWWKRQKDKGICYYCRQAFKPSLLTMDHIVPLARGGRSVRGNVAPACKTCNNAKKSRLVMEWDAHAVGAESPHPQLHRNKS